MLITGRNRRLCTIPLLPDRSSDDIRVEVKLSLTATNLDRVTPLVARAGKKLSYKSFSAAAPVCGPHKESTGTLELCTTVPLLVSPGQFSAIRFVVCQS